MPSFLIVLAFGALTLIETTNVGQKTFAFLIGCSALVWLTTIIQLRFKHVWATAIVGVGGLLLMLVALGAISPTQMLEEVKSFRK